MRTASRSRTRTTSRVSGKALSIFLFVLPCSATLADINIEYQDSGVTILQHRHDAEMEAPVAVQGRQVLEFLDADDMGDPNWISSGTVGGSSNQAWLRNAMASISTTTTVAGGALVINLQGDNNDGRCEIYVGGVLRARLDMNDSPGTNNVQVIVDSLAVGTHDIVVDDIGESVTNPDPNNGNDDCAVWGAAVLTPPPVLNPGDIDHVIVLMMENRSFDHTMGAWVPNANGHSSFFPVTYYTEPNGGGTAFHPKPLAPDFQGCTKQDPAHDSAGGRCEWDSGAADGWLFEDEPVQDCTTNNDDFSIGYYKRADLDFYSGVVDEFTVLDNYFAPIMAGTFANRFFQYSADTDRLNTGETSPDPSSGCPGIFSKMKTIFDLLNSKGVSWRYYYSDVPFLAQWGPKYATHIRTIEQFFEDATPGDPFSNLPAVAFIDPKFLDEKSGTSIDDHPKADIRAGQFFMNSVYDAVIHSDEWTGDGQVVLVINHDEWGGFFDHVNPKAAGGGANPPQGACQASLEAAYSLAEPGLRGFRVPAIVISPWAPRGAVAHELYDHTSILKMIEWNWDLGNLNSRDLTTTNLANALTATKDQRQPTFTITPALSESQACDLGGGGVVRSQWADLLSVARRLGFDVPDYPQSSPIPAVTPWGMLALLLLQAALAWWILARKRRRA